MKSSKFLVIAIIFIASVQQLFSQGINWKLNGNNNVTDNNFIGPKNYQDFVIKTDNKERFRITKDGEIISKGYFLSDSIRTSGPLYIGDSSLAFHNDIWTGIGSTDRISSNNIAINFMRRQFSGHFYTSNIRIGIGLQTPRHMLHLHHSPLLFNKPAHPVYMAFTNLSGGTPQGTGNLATDGFLVGIAANGNAQLIQQENKDMLFYTPPTGDGTPSCAHL